MRTPNAGSNNLKGVSDYLQPAPTRVMTLPYLWTHQTMCGPPTRMSVINPRSEVAPLSPRNVVVRTPLFLEASCQRRASKTLSKKCLISRAMNWESSPTIKIV